MVKSFCKDCPNRHTICHDTCPQYQRYKLELKAENAYGYDEITADKRDKLLDLLEAREAAQNSRKAGDNKYHDLVTEMLETAIRRVGNEYADLLFEHDQQCREAEKQCEQLAAERMRKS